MSASVSLPEVTSADIIEIEWQFDTADLPAVETWLLAHAAERGFSVTAGAALGQTDLYLETEDWRFYRAGYTLRLRRLTGTGGFEATLKALKRAETGPQRRREISERLADGRLETLLRAPGGVGQRVRALAGALGPLFVVQTRRRKLRVEQAGAVVATVALDETHILVRQGGATAHLQRVEVEAEGAPDAELEALVAAAQAGCGLQPAALSKYEAGLAVCGRQPPPPLDLGPMEVQDALILGEAAWAVMRRRWATFLAHEWGTRLGDETEALHDMRVASRRLRAALSLFADCLPARAARFQDELQWVAAALGEVRDLDVQLERVQAWQAEAGADDPAVLAPLSALIEAQRAGARARLLHVLDSPRYARFVRAYTAMLQSAQPRRFRHRPAARQPVLEAAPGLIVSRYRQMRKAGDDLTESALPLAYHTLRIRSKRLRYALEFLAELYGEPARELAKNVVALQDLLGQHQDAQVAMAQLRALSAAHARRLPPATIFAMGALSQRYAQLAADCQQRLPEVYAGVRGKNWKRLQQLMAERRPSAAPEAAPPEA